MNGPQLPFLALGDKQHPPLSRLSPGQRTHQGGGFSFRSSWKDVTLPKAVECLPVPSHVARADTSVKRGNVFTHSPSPCNPYVIQLSSHYRHLLSVQAKSGKTGLKPHTPHHGLKNRGLRRAKAFSVNLSVGAKITDEL